MLATLDLMRSVFLPYNSQIVLSLVKKVAQPVFRLINPGS
jgi:hypothetical protein